MLLALQPPLVLATLLMHSGTNWMAVSLARKSLPITELCLALIGALVLIAGFAVFGRL